MLASWCLQESKGYKNTGHSDTNGGGKGKQGLLTSLPFWSIAQLGNRPKEMLKHYLKSQAAVKAKKKYVFLMDSISFINQDGRVNEHITTWSDLHLTEASLYIMFKGNINVYKTIL